MKYLSKFWFGESPVDFEMKQYVLLDYLQSVREDFTLRFLYPSLKDLIQQYDTLVSFKFNHEELKRRIGTVTGINANTMEIQYEFPDVNKDFREIDSIVNYSIPMIDQCRQEGAEMFEKIRKSMVWGTVGIVPEYLQEGYFILHQADKHIYVYRYTVSQILNDVDPLWGILCEMVDQQTTSLKNYEEIKSRMIQEHPELPVPMTFCVQVPDMPLEQTVLPIVKRTGLTIIRSKLSNI